MVERLPEQSALANIECPLNTAIPTHSSVTDTELQQGLTLYSGKMTPAFNKFSTRATTNAQKRTFGCLTSNGRNESKVRVLIG